MTRTEKEKLETLQRNLNINEAEAQQVMEDDERIDKGEKLFELDPDQKQAEKKARSTGTRTVYNFQKRERKADNDKRMIINYLQSTLKNWFQSDSQCTYNACINFEIVNPEREFLFTYNGKKYKIVLSAPRT